MVGVLGDVADQFKNMPTPAKLAVVAALGVAGFLVYKAHRGGSSSGGVSIPVDPSTNTDGFTLGAPGVTGGTGNTTVTGGILGSGGTSSSTGSSSTGSSSSATGSTTATHPATVAHVATTAKSGHIAHAGHPAVMWNTEVIRPSFTPRKPPNKPRTVVKKQGVTFGHGRIF